MIIFVNDDRSYLSWVTHHRQGFVLDGKTKHKTLHPIVHRATCREIKVGPSRRTHWTSGGKLKACCLDSAELEHWALSETGALPDYCPSCEPQKAALPDSKGHIHISKLAADILEYVIEAALIHFEIVQPPYRLTVGDIAACFGKTPGQISPALRRLIESGFLTVQGHATVGATILSKRIILPTTAAIRTLESFQGESDSTIETELAKLEAS